MKGSSSSHKRKYLKIDVNPPTSKSKRCSLEETSLDKFKSKRCNNNLEETSMDKLKPEDELISKEQKYHEEEDEEEDEDNNNNGYNSDEGEGEKYSDVKNNKENKEDYLFGDKGSTGIEDLQNGVETKDEDEEENENENENEICSRNFRHGYHLVEGKLKHGMEDYIFAQCKIINGYNLGLYAIFDGHAGRDVAKYLQTHLFSNILNEAGFWKNPVRAVKRACKATDDEILEKVADWRGGSTAVAAILINGVKLLVANVGDSRAISCINGIPRQITIDHDPHREKHLVQSRGGFVSKRPGCAPRVDDQLAMSRAFGDGKLKEHITAEPDVMVHKIDDHTDFIILASDGLWKVMTNEEACDCIKDIDDAKKASKKLVKEALRKGSYDDISCIVVMF